MRFLLPATGLIRQLLTSLNFDLNMKPHIGALGSREPTLRQEALMIIMSFNPMTHLLYGSSQLPIAWNGYSD
ncbi:hypothetical protein DM292_07410 [Stutzerimonas frequens]|nr:hypothetical protein DM292_07410 [Stutzerimonas frequens]